MGKSSGGSAPAGNTTSTQTSSPWSGQQPYLIGQGNGNVGAPGPAGMPMANIPGALPAAASLYANYTPQYFPESTVAPLNQTQQTGLGMEAGYGLNGGNPAVNSATGAINSMENGNFLSAGNPYFQQTANSVLSQVVPQLESQFEGNGRMGSPGAAYAASQGAASAIAPYAFQNYQQGLQNMLQGAMLAPGLQQSQIQNIGLVQNAGQQEQQQTQAEINDAINRWNFQQQLPYNQLAMYEGGVNGNYGGTSTLSQPYFQNNKGTNGLLGGLAGGAAGQLLGGSGSSLASALPKIGMLAAMAA